MPAFLCLPHFLLVLSLLCEPGFHLETGGYETTVAAFCEKPLAYLHCGIVRMEKKVLAKHRRKVD